MDYSSYSILKACYRNINKKRVSSAHKIAHKLMAEWLLEQKHERGEVVTMGAEVLFKNSYEGDLVVYWRNDDVLTENIEICNPLEYLYRVRYNGGKQFKRMVKELLSNSMIDDKQAYHIRRSSIKKVNRRGRAIHKRKGYIDFHTDKPIDSLSFAEKINDPCIIERKLENWEGQTNEISFLLPEEFWPQYKEDIERCGLEIDRVYLISRKSVFALRDANSHQKIHQGLGMLGRPPRLRRKKLICEK